MAVSITKREYTKARAEIDRKIQVAGANCDALVAFIERTTQPGDDARQFLYSKWYDMKNIENDLDRERDALDEQFRRRHWGAADYARRELVANNCD